MMTPREYAIRLTNEFKDEQPVYEGDDDDEFESEKRIMYFAKRCALISVNLLLKQLKRIPKFATDNTHEKSILFFEQVKQEIDKL